MQLIVCIQPVLDGPFRDGSRMARLKEEGLEESDGMPGHF